MAEPERITAEEARSKMEQSGALLVCAYDDEEKCRRMKLKGAISLNELKSKLPALPKEQEIVFYCA